MPLYKTLAFRPDIKCYIWKIEESERELAAPLELTQNSLSRLGSMKSELHRRGFLSIRHLLRAVGYVDSDLYYDSVGKPHLKDGNHISITHSHEFTGIIVSPEKEVGIDIEKQRQKIIRIAHKFSTIELPQPLDSEQLIRKLTILWGAKESLYKIMATRGVSFKEHIDIADFTLSTPHTTGEICFEGASSVYEIAFIEFEGFTCVYALKKNCN